MRLVKESLKDKISGPSEEDMLEKIRNMDPNKAFLESVSNRFFKGVQEVIDKVDISAKIHALSNISIYLNDVYNIQSTREIFNFIFESLDFSELPELSYRSKNRLIEAIGRVGNVDQLKKIIEIVGVKEKQGGEGFDRMTLVHALIRGINFENMEIIDYILENFIDNIPFFVIRSSFKSGNYDSLEFIFKNHMDKIKRKYLDKLKEELPLGDVDLIDQYI